MHDIVFSKGLHALHRLPHQLQGYLLRHPMECCILSLVWIVLSLRRCPLLCSGRAILGLLCIILPIEWRKLCFAGSRPRVESDVRLVEVLHVCLEIAITLLHGYPSKGVRLPPLVHLDHMRGGGFLQRVHLGLHSLHLLLFGQGDHF